MEGQLDRTRRVSRHDDYKTTAVILLQRIFDTPQTIQNTCELRSREFVE